MRHDDAVGFHHPLRFVKSLVLFCVPHLPGHPAFVRLFDCQAADSGVVVRINPAGAYVGRVVGSTFDAVAHGRAQDGALVGGKVWECGNGLFDVLHGVFVNINLR